MTTRRTALQALAGMAAAPGILRARRTPGDKPNLLFLWTDQQRADSMSAYGNNLYRVPVWNKLAAECVVFDRCYDAQPVCTPARSCVMTGTWPHQNGCLHNNIKLRADVKTMPELLDDSSYRTAYMGKWHLGDEVFAQRGFQEWRAIEDGIYQDYYSEGRDKNARSAYHNFLLSQGYKVDDRKHANSFTRDFATRVPVEHSKPSFLAQEAAKFILKNRNDPWMLYVNTLEPHTPFSSALNDLHTPEEAPLKPNHPGIPKGPEPEAYKKRREGFVRDRGKFDLTKPEGWRRMHRNYAGLCSLVDQAWGRILWALEAAGQMENTILVHTSDHGEMMGSHTLMAKSVMYEEAVHVPLLLRVPFRHQKPHHIAQPVSHIDMVPTEARRHLYRVERRSRRRRTARPHGGDSGRLEAGAARQRRLDAVRPQQRPARDGQSLLQARARGYGAAPAGEGGGVPEEDERQCAAARSGRGSALRRVTFSRVKHVSRHVSFVSFAGLRVREEELLALGITLPGLGDRKAAVGQLPLGPADAGRYDAGRLDLLLS
jgi:arylsulfatase A-like enzyme